MALDPALVWATNIANAIQSVKPSDSAPVSTAQLIQIWNAVKTEDTAQLAKADVAPGAFTAPAMGGPVTGVGGPVT